MISICNIHGIVLVTAVLAVSAGLMAQAAGDKPPASGPATSPAVSAPASGDAMMQVHALLVQAKAAKLAKNYDEAANLLKQAVALSPAMPVLHYYLACANALAGHTDDAIAALRQAVAHGLTLDPKQIQAEPDLASLRQEEGFQEVLVKAGQAYDAYQKQMAAIPDGKSRTEIPAAPAGGRKVPLLVFLHGGAGSSDLAVELVGPLAKAWNYALLAPSGSIKTGMRPDGKPGYNWNPDHDVPAIVKEIQTLIDNGTVDPKAIYIAGFSNGATMSYVVALKHPEIIKGAVIFSGMFQGELIGDAAIKNAAGRVPVYIVHGNSDQVMSPKLGTAARDLLKAKGFQVQLKNFEGDHELPPDYANILKDAIARFGQVNATQAASPASAP